MQPSSIYPKVLVLSINPFSKTGSNGKVLYELFTNWTPERLAQFYIYNQEPDFKICKNYFRITDKEALKAFLTGQKSGQILSPSFCGEGAVIQKAKSQISSATPIRKPIKNPLTSLLRNIVWNSGRWKTQAFYSWVENFSPDIILLMAGGNSSLHNIAIDISKKFKLPLVVYNTENYYFKNYNYFTQKSFGFLYPLFRWENGRVFKRLMKHSSYEIYGNDTLSELYTKEFGKKNIVIYQPTSLALAPTKKQYATLQFSYIGNLGLDRHITLQEIAKALQKISPKYFLDIYGKAPSDIISQELTKAPGIRYHGYISYDEVLKKIEESDVLFHAESFTPWRVKDLQTGFSTKISDSLASGRCFVLYADKSIACSQYCLQHECAHVITSQDDLLPTLQAITSDSKTRLKYIENAKIIVEKNHHATKNSEKLRSLLVDIIHQYKKR